MHFNFCLLLLHPKVLLPDMATIHEGTVGSAISLRSTVLAVWHSQKRSDMYCVANVTVVWHDPRRVPFALDLNFFRPKTDSLNNRFDLRLAEYYDAALHVDDDFLLSSRWSATLTWHGFGILKASSSSTLGMLTWISTGIDGTTCRRNKYNTGFVTKGGIFATKFLNLYHEPKWAEAGKLSQIIPPAKICSCPPRSPLSI